LCRCGAFEKVDQETLCLIISLPSTARLFSRKRHELFFAEAASEIDKWVRLIFPVTVFGTFVLGELGGSRGVEGSAGCGLEFDDEDFEDFEGRGDDGPLVWICEETLC
jgi:hypothetical protein